MISGDEPARLLDLRFHLRLQDRAVRARDWNCVLPQGCCGQSENKRNCTSAAQLDFSSDANHAVSNYQTVSAAIPGVQENQPPRRPALRTSDKRTFGLGSTRASRVSDGVLAIANFSASARFGRFNNASPVEDCRGELGLSAAIRTNSSRNSASDRNPLTMHQIYCDCL